MGYRGSVVINGKAVLGNNINIANGVTIGETPRGKSKCVPNIGNNVWIEVKAVIVGKVNIGNDFLITSNTFVNFDVPSHAIVIGNPGKVIARENAKEGYLQNTYPISEV